MEARNIKRVKKILTQTMGVRAGPAAKKEKESTGVGAEIRARPTVTKRGIGGGDR